MSNSDKLTEYRPGRFEWGLLVFDIILWLLFAGRLIDPLFLDGQLLPSLAGAFLPGALLTVFGRPSLGTHRLCFALGLLVFLIANGTINPQEIRGALTNWPWVVFGIAVLSLQIITGAWRWGILLHGQGIKLRFITAVKLLTIGFFFNTFIPGSTGGDFYRIYKVAKGNKALVAPVTTSVFLDRLLGLPALLVMVLTGIVINLSFISANKDLAGMAKAYATFTIGSAVFFALLFLLSFYFADRLRNKQFDGFLGRALLQAVESIVVYKNSRRTLLYVILISILSHLATFVAFLAFAQAVELQGVPVTIMLFLVFAGLMVNFIPLAPGGAGQGELAFAWIFAVATPGFPDNAHRAAVMMLCYRLGMLIYGAVGGIIYGVSREEIALEKSTQKVKSTP